MTTKLAQTLLVVLLFLMICPHTYADDCVTTPDDFWLCRGDRAWTTGYLIAPDVFDLRLCAVWKTQAALLDTVLSERDEYRAQRDDTMAELVLQRDRVEVLAVTYDTCAADYNTCTEVLQQHVQELDHRYDTWDVVLIAGGTGAAAVLLGLLIGAVAL